MFVHKKDYYKKKTRAFISEAVKNKVLILVFL